MNLSDIIRIYGIDKLNTLTKYPSIQTLHHIGDKKTLLNQLTTTFNVEEMTASEKIDGQNIRLIFLGDERIVGTRDHLFYFNDIFANKQLPKNFFTLSETVRPFFEREKWNPEIAPKQRLTVLYGELYGGNIGQNAKQYTSANKLNFRAFDVAVFENLQILKEPLAEISNWREHTLGDGSIGYGQKFLDFDGIIEEFPMFDYVPNVEFDLSDLSHEGIMKSLLATANHSQVRLDINAPGKPEGVMIRNASRTKILKIRFEDYERTLRKKYSR